MLATAAERDAVLAALGPGAPFEIARYDAVRSGDVTLVVSGVGPSRAAAAAATALTRGSYDGVLSLGICGGFSPRAGIGHVVVASAFVAADVGAHSAEGFLGLAELGWEAEAISAPPGLVTECAARLEAAGLPVVTGPVVTVSAATGTDERAAELAARHQAVAEAMEGRGVADAAAGHGVPVLEVRAVSNAVGRRDTSTWDIPGALRSLSAAVTALRVEELPWDR